MPDLGVVDAPARETAAELARLALDDGIGTFVVSANDPAGLIPLAAQSQAEAERAIDGLWARAADHVESAA